MLSNLSFLQFVLPGSSKPHEIKSIKSILTTIISYNPSTLHPHLVELLSRRPEPENVVAALDFSFSHYLAPRR